MICPAKGLGGLVIIELTMTMNYSRVRPSVLLLKLGWNRVMQQNKEQERSSKCTTERLKKKRNQDVAMTHSQGRLNLFMGAQASLNFIIAPLKITIVIIIVIIMFCSVIDFIFESYILPTCLHKTE